MATYNLNRFSHAEVLKTIDRKHLLALMEPFAAYFNERGMILPLSSSENLDYEQLRDVLMSPDAHTPKELLEALYYVHEMATTECMDILLQEADNNGIILDENPTPTPADIAVQFYLQNKELLERKHAEQYLVKPRSFEYFKTDAYPIPQFKQPAPETVTALEGDLDDWFDSKKRGRGTRVFIYTKAEATWFLVRHGDPYKREGSLEGDEPSSVFYRPEKYDILVYDPELGEIRMYACGKAEKETLRRAFGSHLFDDENFFPGKAKYTLLPLQTNGKDSIVCTDVEGMDWVKLKEIKFLWGGNENEIETRRADDVFAAYAGREGVMPVNTKITKASFLVKFTDNKTPRTVTILTPNVARYARDIDSIVVEDWLTRRGFIVGEQEDSEN